MNNLTNFFSVSLRENVDDGMWFFKRGLKHCVNFSEDYVCFGRDCYVILSKDQNNFELKKEEAFSSVAQKIMYFMLTIALVPPVVCFTFKLLHRIVVKCQGLNLSEYVKKAAAPKPTPVKVNPTLVPPKVKPTPVVPPKNDPITSPSVPPKKIPAPPPADVTPATTPTPPVSSPTEPVPAAPVIGPNEPTNSLSWGDEEWWNQSGDPALTQEEKDLQLAIMNSKGDDVNVSNDPFPAVTVTPTPVETPEEETKLVIPTSFPPLAYGMEAFNQPAVSDLDQYPVFTNNQIDQILESYVTKEGNKIFHQLNPRVNGGKAPGAYAREIIKSTYKNGLPNFPTFKSDITNGLAIILDTIRPESDHPKTKKRSIAERLADGFTACQDEQFSTVQTLSKELLSKGNLTESLAYYWQDYKMQKLAEIVNERHPTCQMESDSYPQKQFPHVKNAYIVLLGKQFGLGEIEKAAADKVRPATILKGFESQSSIENTFIERLDLNEFIMQVVNDINNPDPLQECSRLEKKLVLDWGNTNGYIGFGYYNPSKDYNGLPMPTEDQEYLKETYVSPNEVRFLLQKMGITN